jgi:putative phosphoesterase
MRIGLIADTHGLLRPEAVSFLAGVDIILHAGDVGRGAVLAGLRELAPVHAVRGNVDRTGAARELPEWLDLKFGGVRIALTHVRPDASAAAAADVVVFGHSHHPLIDEAAGRLWVNPGSAGPRRFSLPVSLGRLDLQDGRATARLETLRPGSGGAAGPLTHG